MEQYLHCTLTSLV